MCLLYHVVLEIIKREEQLWNRCRVSVLHLLYPFEMRWKWFLVGFQATQELIACIFYYETKTTLQADLRVLYVMDIYCNVTTLEAQTQINSTIYHLVKMVSMCVSCALNAVLSVPLLLVITRSPSLLRHTRFLLLTHLLLCDDLQVGLHFLTLDTDYLPFDLS